MDSAQEEVIYDNLSASDCLLLIGGTNNFSNNSLKQHQLTPEQIKQRIQSQISLFNQTNLILTTIPYRYDKAENSIENQLIKEVNCELRSLAYQNRNIQLIDLHIIERQHHTRHGFHINRSGKKHIAKQTVDLANSIVRDPKIQCYASSPVQSLNSVTAIVSSSATSTSHVAQKHRSETTEPRITTVEANMTRMLEQSLVSTKEDDQNDNLEVSFMEPLPSVTAASDGNCTGSTSILSCEVAGISGDLTVGMPNSFSSQTSQPNRCESGTSDTLNTKNLNVLKLVISP